MTANAKIAIPLTVLIPVVIALSAWQWGLQERITKTETRSDMLLEDLRDIKTMINQNYLMNRRQMDSIAQDVTKLMIKMENKADKRWNHK